ncbi:MAG: VOC family protein [Candidatus Binataceae bacterium]
MIKRLATLDVATSDLGETAETYRRNFSFAVKASPDGATAVVTVGDAEIRLRADSSAAQFVAQNGEGMSTLWLEADDVTIVAAALKRAGHEVGEPRIESGRRVLAIDPKISNQVPLFIFDRKI